MSFRDYKEIQITALSDFLGKEAAYHERHIMRWFSKEFHTPLDQVAELDFNEVLRSYYEVYFEGLSKEDLEKERKRLTQTAEESLKEELEEDQFLDLVKKVDSKPTQAQTAITEELKGVAQKVNLTKETIKKALEDFKEIDIDFAPD